MAHCTKCGAAVGENAAFCPGCGSPQAARQPAPQGAGPVVAAGAGAQTGMAENVAATLSYVLGWVTGLIFYFIDKRPFVRYHAAQSIVAFGGLHVVMFVLGVFFGLSLLAGGFAGFSFGYVLFHIVQLVIFIIWIVCMIKAYQGARFRVPVAADLAEKIFGKN
jgi:uncharacterized membrane protein